MRELRALAEDGLELLGEVELGGRLVVGDPARFVSEGGAVRVNVAPGRWFALGRAWERDADELSELVLVHPSALGAFYAIYDGLLPAGEAEITARRVAALDASIAADPAVIASLYEPDELPWVLAAGLVAGEGPGSPARVFRATGEPTTMVMIALGPEPLQRAAAPEWVVDDEG